MPKSTTYCCNLYDGTSWRRNDVLKRFGASAGSTTLGSIAPKVGQYKLSDPTGWGSVTRHRLTSIPAQSRPPSATLIAAVRPVTGDIRRTCKIAAWSNSRFSEKASFPTPCCPKAALAARIAAIRARCSISEAGNNGRAGRGRLSLRLRQCPLSMGLRSAPPHRVQHSATWTSCRHFPQCSIEAPSAREQRRSRAKPLKKCRAPSFN